MSVNATLTRPTVAAPATLVLTVASNTGSQLALAAVVKDAGGNVLTGRTITWVSSNPNVAQVDATGVVTPVSAGNCVITASIGAVSDTLNLTVA